jgi:hypothetical protein
LKCRAENIELVECPNLVYNESPFSFRQVPHINELPFGFGLCPTSSCGRYLLRMADRPNTNNLTHNSIKTSRGLRLEMYRSVIPPREDPIRPVPNACIPLLIPRPVAKGRVDRCQFRCDNDSCMAELTLVVVSQLKTL